MDMSGMEGMEGMDATMVLTTDRHPTGTVFAAAASASTPLTTPTPARPHNLEGAASSPGEMGSMAPTMGMSGMSGMSSMSNAFHFGVGDTLWFTRLTPTNGQGYAGDIILLVLMAVILRLLTTLRGMAEKRWNPKQPSRCSDEADTYLKMGQDRDEDGEAPSGHRWNTTIQIIRAVFQLGTMTIGYFLMLAVMTFNAGYLLAIFFGGFLGELTLGWIKH